MASSDARCNALENSLVEILIYVTYVSRVTIVFGVWQNKHAVIIVKVLYCGIALLQCCNPRFELAVLFVGLLILKESRNNFLVAQIENWPHLAFFI